ncbi:MAG: integrase core domain-containing protein [Planctomycetaceae bacterium]
MWRSVKYEEIYLKSYSSGADRYAGLKAYFHYYTHDRPHQALGNRTPWEAFKTTP